MRHDTESILNELIETCRDGENGFLEAAESIHEGPLRSLLAEFAEQRRQFALQLQYEVSKLGKTPVTRGSFLGNVHHRWMDVKAAMTGGGVTAILNECQRGEEMAKKAYEKALAASLPPNIKELVEQQYTQIRESYGQIKDVELKFHRLPA